MRVRLQPLQPLQYLRAFFLGVLDLLGEQEALLGALGGQAFLIAVPRLSFTDQLDSIQQHGGICALPITVIRRSFLVLLVPAPELLEKVQDLAFYFLEIAYLILRIDHKLMKEVLDLDILTQSQRTWLETELYAMLGQKRSKGQHFQLKFFEDIVAQIQDPFFQGERDILVVEVKFAVSVVIAGLESDYELTIEGRKKLGHLLDDLQLSSTVVHEFLADQHRTGTLGGFLQLAEGIILVHLDNQLLAWAHAASQHFILQMGQIRRSLLKEEDRVAAAGQHQEGQKGFFGQVVWQFMRGLAIVETPLYRFLRVVNANTDAVSLRGDDPEVDNLMLVEYQAHRS